MDRDKTIIFPFQETFLTFGVFSKCQFYQVTNIASFGTYFTLSNFKSSDFYEDNICYTL